MNLADWTKSMTVLAPQNLKNLKQIIFLREIQQKRLYSTPFQEGKLAETQKYTSNILGFFSGVFDMFLLVDVNRGIIFT